MGAKKNRRPESFSIYGINGCTQLLESNQYNINQIYIQDGSHADKNRNRLHIKSKHSHLIKVLSKQSFLNRFETNRTQGIVVEFSGDVIHKELLHFNDKKSSCILVVDQIEDPQNFGQIIRTAECAGVDAILFPKHHSAPISNTVLQVSQGAFIHIPLCEAVNLKQAFHKLKEDGFWIIGLENSINAQEWHKLDYSGKIVIVVGSEGKGIRQKILESCDFKATIPMQGRTNSLNVSAAVSAILFERLRQTIE